MPNHTYSWGFVGAGWMAYVRQAEEVLRCLDTGELESPVIPWTNR